MCVFLPRRTHKLLHQGRLLLSRLQIASFLQLSNLQLSNLQLSILQPSNLQLSNLQLSNLQLSNLQLSNLQPSNLDLSLWGSEYPQNFLKIVQVTDNPPDRQRPHSEECWCCGDLIRLCLVWVIENVYNF